MKTEHPPSKKTQQKNKTNNKVHLQCGYRYSILGFIEEKFWVCCDIEMMSYSVALLFNHISFQLYRKVVVTQ